MSARSWDDIAQKTRENGRARAGVGWKFEIRGYSILTLGAVYRVDAVALWNTSGDGAIDQFTLFADTESNFGGATDLGDFRATPAEGSGRLAEVFTFGAINARYLRVQATAATFDFVRFNEFAASGTAVEKSSVPEPSSLAIFAIGGCIMGLGYTRRRKRMVAA